MVALMGGSERGVGGQKRGSSTPQAQLRNLSQPREPRNTTTNYHSVQAKEWSYYTTALSTSCSQGTGIW